MKKWWKDPVSDPFKITLNLAILIIALILMLYEIIYLQPSQGVEQQPPAWFKIGDVIIIFTLILEVFMDYLVHNFNCRLFLHSWFNVLDVCVVILSIIGMCDYVSNGEDTSAATINNASLLVVLKSIAIRSVRVARIVVLAVRTYWEYHNYDEEDYLVLGGRVSMIDSSHLNLIQSRLPMDNEQSPVQQLFMTVDETHPLLAESSRISGDII